jgi:hypothetical protein
MKTSILAYFVPSIFATIRQRLLGLVPMLYGLGGERQIKGKFHWLKLLTIFFGSLMQVGANQFGDFTYTDNGMAITITDYPTTARGDVVIPTMILGKPVISIANSAFSYCSALTSVTIPSSVTSIGIGVFDQCSNLVSLTMVAPNSQYSSEDGVLFNTWKTSLIECPEGKSGAYTIPPIEENVFRKFSFVRRAKPTDDLPPVFII